MSKTNFSSTALDQLINQCTEDLDDLTNDITSYDKNDIAPATDPDTTDLINKNSGGENVDYVKVYAQLERLIANGNIALETLNSLDIDVLSIETITATTSLMNAIKNCISEFTKIHLNHIRYMQKLNIMEKEQQNRIQLLAEKAKLYNQKNNSTENTFNTNQMIQVGCDDLLKFVKFQQEQK